MAQQTARRVAPQPNAYRQELDAYQAKLGRAIALAVGRYLECRGNLHQPIQSLQIEELEGMAWAAIAEYGNLRTAKEKEEAERQPPPPDRMYLAG